MDETTTKKLNEMLAGIHTTKQMEKFMEEPKVTGSHKSFAEYFRSLPKVQALSDPQLIARSGIERSYYYQIIKGTKTPGRDKILRLCIGAGLDSREATRALELGGCAALYPKNRRDIILSVAINQSASVDEANLLLDKYGEEPLS